LFGSQFVTQAIGGQFHVVVGQRSIFRKIALQTAAFGQSHWQQPLGTHHIRIFALAVGHVVANAIQRFTGLEVSFGNGDDIHHRPRDRREDGILKQHDPRHG